MRRPAGLIVALTMLTACADLSGPKTHLRISGVITDASTGAAVSGATVILENIEILIIPSSPIAIVDTDSRGRYSLDFTSENTCLEILRLRVSAAGYQESFTNHASGNAIECTSDQQLVDIGLRRQ